MPQQPIQSPLSGDALRETGDALQQTVVDLIDLSLIAKQAHWNVVGPHFRSVHLLLDEVVAATRGFTDAAAERATAIGVSPNGQAATVVKESSTSGIESGWQSDSVVIAAMVTNLRDVITRLRRHIEVTETSDPVTQDLLIGVAARLEQLHWMWQAQQA
ncbi:DNA starvation/stationary phase protection protein [Nocardia sp. NPDC051030]|uniref:Dps family protein n=1 Tax=Nocardia sp. NPDC051030 TaxID=3155162 RepID=UPI0034339094